MPPTLTDSRAAKEAALLKALYAERDRREKAQERAQEKAQRARESLREFVKQAWHIVEPAKELIPNWHIDAISDHLQAVAEAHIRYLVINVGPGYAKSMIVSVLFSAWLWTRDPKLRVLAGSYATKLSERDNIKARSLIESEWYQDSFVSSLPPEQQWKLTKRNEDHIQNSKSGFRMAVSVDSIGTGFRGDGQILDDVLNVKEANSEAQRETARRWVFETMSNRFNDMRTGWRVAIGQRLHEEDPYGHMLKSGQYEHLCLPSEYESKRPARSSIGFVDPRKEDGELLFPELFPQEVLDQAKIDLGSYGYAGQHQQRPSPEEGGIIKRHWWRFWEPARTGAVSTVLPQRFDEVIISVDCAFKDLKSSDFVSMQAWGRLGANKYLLDRVKERMDYVATEAAFERFCMKHPTARAKYVEEKANGAALISRMRGKIPGIIPVNPTDSKIARVYAETPQIEAGNVFLPLPANAPWVNDFIEECAAFPNGAHDDDVDAMTQALAKMTRANNKLFLMTGSVGY